MCEKRIHLKLVGSYSTATAISRREKHHADASQNKTLSTSAKVTDGHGADQLREKEKLRRLSMSGAAASVCSACGPNNSLRTNGKLMTTAVATMARRG